MRAKNSTEVILLQLIWRIKLWTRKIDRLQQLYNLITVIKLIQSILHVNKSSLYYERRDLLYEQREVTSQMWQFHSRNVHTIKYTRQLN